MKNFQPKTFKDEKKSVTVFRGLCKGCFLCIEKCPVKAIESSPEDLGVYSTPSIKIEIKKCTGCGICETICPDCALKVNRKK